jgi:hypothetical protein
MEFAALLSWRIDLSVPPISLKDGDEEHSDESARR